MVQDIDIVLWLRKWCYELHYSSELLLNAAMFILPKKHGIDLYSVHWVHEANHNRASSRCYSDFTIVHHNRFCEANWNMEPGSPARTKIRDVTQWSLYKSIPPKNMAAFKPDITSAVLNWYWPRTFLHTFPTKLSIESYIACLDDMPNVREYFYPSKFRTVPKIK